MIGNSASDSHSEPPFREAFGDWRTIEIFGPPGAGKSSLCNWLRASYDIPNAFDSSNETVFAYDKPYVQSFVSRLTPSTLKRTIFKRRMKNSINSIYMALRIPSQDEFISVIDNTVLTDEDTSAKARSVLVYRALTIAYLTQTARFRRLLFDEGITKNYMDLMVRTSDPNQKHKLMAMFERILDQYPADKNALLITAPPAECMIRQRQRGYVVATDALPQNQFHSAAELVARSCSRLGWRVMIVETAPSGAIDKISTFKD